MTVTELSNEIELFNSPLETGIRSLIVLNAVYLLMFDLSQLTWFDHLVVHTGDIGGPDSLHPDLPYRGGELLVRRAVIEQGLKLLRRIHLVDIVINEEGIFYQASDEAYPFVELMRSDYAKALKERAVWLAGNVCSMNAESIERLVSEKIGRWKVEFQGLDFSYSEGE